jgi:hypothetical protein
MSIKICSLHPNTSVLVGIPGGKQPIREGEEGRPRHSHRLSILALAVNSNQQL